MGASRGDPNDWRKMGYSKADFKARREALGLSQANVADEADVTVTSVKRWERPGFPEPPEDVWHWIELCEQAQHEAVEAAVSAAIVNGKQVQINYYRSQEQFDECGRDSGPFGMANASSRLVAARLKALKIDVDFSYPDDVLGQRHSGW